MKDETFNIEDLCDGLLPTFEERIERKKRIQFLDFLVKFCVGSDIEIKIEIKVEVGVEVEVEVEVDAEGEGEAEVEAEAEVYV